MASISKICVLLACLLPYSGGCSYVICKRIETPLLQAEGFQSKRTVWTGDRYLEIKEEHRAILHEGHTTIIDQKTRHTIISGAEIKLQEQPRSKGAKWRSQEQTPTLR